MAYGAHTDLPRRTTSDKVLCGKVFAIASSPKYDGYQWRVTSMVFDKFFHKKSIIIPEEQKLASELHRSISRKTKKSKIYLSFWDAICGADLAGMQSISKYNTGVRFLLCVNDVYSKYVWVVPLKHQKGITITNTSGRFWMNLDMSGFEISNEI